MRKYGRVGKNQAKLNAWELVSGKTKYTGDLAVSQRTLYGYVIRSPYPHARVTGIDTSEAERMPDVRAVLTPFNIPQTKFGLTIYDESILTDKPRYIGDEVAAVAATSEEAARLAAEQVKITYEVLPAVFDVEQAMEPDSICVHEGKSNIAHSPRVKVGNADEALKQSAVRLDMEFQTQIQNNAAIEPYSCIASWNDSSGLTLWAPLQDPANTHGHLSRVLGIPMSKIRIIQPYIGGSFGGKLFHRKLTYVCSQLAVRSGEPVYMSHTMEEELAFGRPRVPAKIKLELGADSDGMLTAQKTRIIADNGAYSGYAPGPVNVMSTRTHILYRTPAIDTESFLVYTNKIPTGSMRGFGNITMLFALESAIDSLAREAGLDPVEFRKRNIYKEGEESVLGWKINSSRLGECLDAVAQDAAKWRREGPDIKTGDKARGIGIACGVHVSSNRTRPYDGACAQVRINEDGSVTVFSGDGDVGQGIETVQAMIVAEVLGIDISQIGVAPVDTSYSPFGLGVFADRGTTISGKAMWLAAEDAKEQLLEAAAVMMNADKEDLKLSKGTVIAPDGRKVSMAEVAAYTLWKRNGRVIMGMSNYDPNTIPLNPAENYQGNPSTGYTFCAQAAEVEVDMATGRIKVLRISTAHDSGTIINPLIAEGQIQGAVIQGLGFALTENLKIEEGKVINSNFRSYKIPTFMDIPEIKVSFIESHEDTGPFGAKGIGQTGGLIVAPAIANAVYDAAGVRLTQLPLTPERVWQALRQRQSSKEE